MTLVYLPSYSPELNPVYEFGSTCGSAISVTGYSTDYEAIVDALCHAWKQLTAERFRR